MARRRKTASERRQESSEADQRAWAVFSPKLTAVRSFKDAFLLMADTVRPDSPGRRYYSNLGFFLQSFAPPAGANAMELNEYLRLIRLFDSEGALKKGVRAEIEEKLIAAIGQRFG